MNYENPEIIITHVVCFSPQNIDDAVFLFHYTIFHFFVVLYFFIIAKNNENREQKSH